eukprot:159041-Rhodomonas_salina.1
MIATAQQVCPEGKGSPAGTWWNGRCRWGPREPCWDGVEWSLPVGPVGALRGQGGIVVAGGAHGSPAGTWWNGRRLWGTWWNGRR